MKINNFAAEESRIMHSLPSLIRQPPVIKKVRLSCEFLFMHFRRLLSFFLYFMRGTQVFAVFRLSEAKRDSRLTFFPPRCTLPSGCASRFETGAPVTLI
jgi:hypothetical protein